MVPPIVRRVLIIIINIPVYRPRKRFNFASINLEIGSSSRVDRGCPGDGRHERPQPVGVHQEVERRRPEWYDQRVAVAVQSGRRPDERQRQTRMDRRRDHLGARRLRTRFQHSW